MSDKVVNVPLFPSCKRVAHVGEWCCLEWSGAACVRRAADITEYLDIAGTVVCDGGGAVATLKDAVVDLTKATVKEEIVKEVMDVEKGAEIKLNAADPKLKTAPTRVGLFYQLREGETLGGMKDGDSKVGDGEAWTPNITVKGGNSAFYSIGVGKDE